MPRSRQVPDEEVLAATAQAIVRLGPEMTLADVAAAAGIAPATLIQRYGSKRALLLILARRGFGSAATLFGAARGIHASRVEALIGTLCEAASGMTPDPAWLAIRLAGVHGDSCDPDLREIADRQMREWQGEIRNLLDEAILWSELRECDRAQLAQAVHAIYVGALWQWAVMRQGKIEDWVRRELETVLAPYRTD